MTDSTVHRIAAFSDDPAGGNPAGVVVAEAEPDAAWMQQVAANVGYSETAFLWPRKDREWDVRYFSPQAEVPFCGHATIAAGALLARQHGDARHLLHTRAGEVALDVAAGDGRPRAALTSVSPAVLSMPDGLVEAALASFGWTADVLDAALPGPAVASAGARHLLLPLTSRELLAAMDYDFEVLRDLMLEHDLTTVALLWRESATVWHARNAFPVGSVVEDPATGAAAAALGGWLREARLVDVPADVVVHQGVDLGRPSRIDVCIPAAGGIVVTGAAAWL